MAGRLSGRVAIVTGGSRGIGLGIAERFVEEGARLVIVGRDAESGAAAAAALGGNAVFLEGDIALPETSAAMADLALSRFGRLDILCHNAGIFPETRIEAMTLAEWERVLAVNLTSTFLSVQACLPAMRKAGWGRVVLTSSITGPLVGNPGMALYSASKAGMEGFPRTAAIEVAAEGITVNAIQPGNVLTAGLRDTLGERHIRTMEAAVPMGRLGTTRDIANLALFLAGEESAYITGQAIAVDGGQTLPESRTGAT